MFEELAFRHFQALGVLHDIIEVGLFFNLDEALEDLVRVVGRGFTPGQVHLHALFHRGITQAQFLGDIRRTICSRGLLQ